MTPILTILLQAATAATPAPAAAPASQPGWTAPVTGTNSTTVRAYPRSGSGRLTVRCDSGAEKVVSIQFSTMPVDIGATPPPGRPVSITVDDATPLISNWEFPGRAALQREDAAVTTLAAAFAHARTIKLHTVNATGEPIDVTYDGPKSDAGIVQVLGACGYTLGQVPVRQPAPADKPAGQ